MPQQFFRNDFIGQSAPIQQNIRNAAGHLSSGIQSGIQAYQANAQQKSDSEANMNDFQTLKTFYEPTGIQFDWNSIVPRSGETNAQYRERLKVETLPIGEQLDRMGFDPREIAKTASIPGVTMDTMIKLRQKRISSDITKQLGGEQPEGATSAIKAGQMSPDRINQQYNTNISTDDYNKQAGIAPPDPNFKHVPGTNDFKQAAAADQPIAPPIQPPSYTQGQSLVNRADLPADQKKVFDPILTGLANKDIVNEATAPGSTSEDLYRGIGKSGAPLTELGKEIGGAMDKQDSLAYKNKALDKKDAYVAMKRREDELAYLKVLIGNRQFNLELKRKYGEQGDSALKELTDLKLKQNELETLAQAIRTDTSGDLAFSYQQQKKAIPDPFALDAQSRIIGNRISDIESSYPDIVSAMRNLDKNPTSVGQVTIDTPVPGDAEPSEYTKAESALSQKLGRAPTPVEVQKLMNNPTWKNRGR